MSRKPALVEEKELLSVVPEEFLKYAAAAVWLPVDVVRRWEKNPRKNEDAIVPVMNSIKTFGFVAPICIWTSKQEMVADHTRLSAFERLVVIDPAFVPRGAPGPGLVPVRFHEFRDAAEAHAYAVADNKLHELATWDRDLLPEVMLEFREERLVFDATGFEFADFFLPEGVGKSGDDSAVGPNLQARFGVPPFSVLDARAGYWQDRKRQWIAFGIRGDVGRGDTLDAEVDVNPSRSGEGGANQQMAPNPNRPGGKIGKAAPVVNAASAFQRGR